MQNVNIRIENILGQSIVQEIYCKGQNDMITLTNKCKEKLFWGRLSVGWGVERNTWLRWILHVLHHRLSRQEDLFMITMTTPSSDCWRYKLHQSKSANLFLCPTPRRICIVFLDIISSGSVHSIACWVVTSICWIISNNAIMSWPWIQSTFKYMECLTGYLWSKRDIH